MFQINLNQKARIQNICSHASSKMNPIFEQVLVEASNNTVRFSASNGTQFNTITLDAQVTEQMSFTLSAKRLSAVLTALTAETARFEVKDESLTIKSGKSRLKSPVFPACAYPNAPLLTFAETTIECTIAQLTALFNTASYAVARNDVRSYLCHVNLSVAEQTVKVCATDGHRLSQLTHDNLQCSGQGSYLIPTSLISCILAQDIDPSTMVYIEFDSLHARIASSNTSVVTVLGDGKYPDVNRVIPPAGSNFVVFNLSELKNTVKRFHAVASLEKAPILKFSIGTHIELSVSSIDKSNVFSELIEGQITLEHQEPMCVGINPSYLADALSKQSGESITIYFSSTNAILITCEVEELVTLLMPVRV